MLWYSGGGGGDSALGDSVLSTDELILSTENLSDPTSKHRGYSADDDDDGDVTPYDDVTGYFNSLPTQYRRKLGKSNAASISCISSILLYAGRAYIAFTLGGRGLVEGFFGYISPKPEWIWMKHGI